MIKKIIFFLVIIFVSSVAIAQNTENKIRTLPSVEVRTMEGGILNTSKIFNDGKPIILSFWATWCKPCIKELSSIAEVYDDWQKETGVKLIVVSIDDARTSSSVKPFVIGKNWNYEVLQDINGNFKRAMNVNMIPHTFIIDGKGNIVWQHTSFNESSEFELIKIVKKIIANEKL